MDDLGLIVAMGRVGLTWWVRKAPSIRPLVEEFLPPRPRFNQEHSVITVMMKSGIKTSDVVEST